MAVVKHKSYELNRLISTCNLSVENIQYIQHAILSKDDKIKTLQQTTIDLKYNVSDNVTEIIQLRNINNSNFISKRQMIAKCNYLKRNNRLLRNQKKSIILLYGMRKQMLYRLYVMFVIMFVFLMMLRYFLL
jgi:hypothetical protein